MLPTLNGRLQTRIFMLVVFGGVITLLITPLLPGLDLSGESYRTTYAILLTVLVLGVLWELLYHFVQQFRWEKDWPTMFGLLTAVNEGALVWLLLALEVVPGVDGVPSFWAFLIMFGIVWLAIWVWTNGPMRVPFIRWRFFGGRIV